MKCFKGNDVVIDTDILQRAHYNFSCFFDMLFDRITNCNIVERKCKFVENVIFLYKFTMKICKKTLQGHVKNVPLIIRENATSYCLVYFENQQISIHKTEMFPFAECKP